MLCLEFLMSDDGCWAHASPSLLQPRLKAGVWTTLVTVCSGSSPPAGLGDTCRSLQQAHFCPLPPSPDVSAPVEPGLLHCCGPELVAGHRPLCLSHPIADRRPRSRVDGHLRLLCPCSAVPGRSSLAASCAGVPGL